MTLKYHISVKFVAIIMAALCLLVALGSVVGILALASNDLYESSFDEVYQEQMSSTRRDFAVNLAHRYASLSLGGVPEDYLSQYHGISWYFNTFVDGKYFYQIRDELGMVVESTLDEADDLEEANRFDILVTNISYRHLLTQEEIAQYTAEQDGLSDGDFLPIPDDDVPGSTVVSEPLDSTGPTSPDGAWSNSDDPQETPIYQDGYYNMETNEYEEIFFYYDSVSLCTVELYLLPGALVEDTAWSMIHTLWEVRYQLLYILAGALLLLAVAVVYLCCVAGRSARDTDVRPGGLNRIPLDIYLGVLLVGEFALIWLAATLVDLFFHVAPQIMVPVAGFVGYAGCLLLVAFAYAFVAQIKMPHGYWWRHSVTGWCLLKIWRGLRRLRSDLRAMVSMLPLIWQVLLIVAAMVLLPVVILLLILLTHWELLLLPLISSLIADVFLLGYACFSFGVLMKGTRQMAQGNLDYQIPLRNLVGPFRDFAQQLNTLADAAQIAAARQMRSERMKTELITNVSHDIKTPLTSIINYVDLLQKPHTQQEGESYLEVLSRQSQRMKKLIEDLMDMSKASTGNMPTDITPVDAAEAVNQCLGEFADKLSAAQLVPVFREPEQPVIMMADGKLVWRVMSNLLGNTVKYALPGTRIYIDLTRQENCVMISMKNISREELNVSADELMERFVRGDASRNTEGSGLGLNIAQSLMDLQHGKLELLVDGDLFKVTLYFPAAE